MSKLLHRDPERRCKPIAEWPARDRALWEAALAPGDLFEDGGARTKHSEISNRNAVYGYGRWLAWLEFQGLLDGLASPADRITPDRVKAYIAELAKHNSTQTILNRLQELHAVAVVMDPNRDWSWIHRLHSQVRFRHKPARPKGARVTGVRELLDLGIHLMEAAEQETTPCKRAIVFRNGLMIALLAARLLRLRNLTGLVLNRTVVLRGTQWWIEIPASETKTKQPIVAPWPEGLDGYLETYLARHRSVLAALHQESRRPPGDALWIAKTGSPMDRRTIYATIVHLTHKSFGRPINPQLFRDCGITSISVEAPRDIGIASPILGHQSPRTTEKYYNQARAIEAARRMQEVLLARRRAAARRSQSRS
jgi:integrase/recombinase XerD